jgi:large subunit ribosomal protein L18
MAKTSQKAAGRIRRKKHIRKVVYGTEARPRLCVFRSTKHIYAQIIDDDSGKTLASASSLPKNFGGNSGGNIEGAKAVGALIGEKARAAGITTVVFDRNGYLYHGRVASLADGAREAGLEF